MRRFATRVNDWASQHQLAWSIFGGLAIGTVWLVGDLTAHHEVSRALLKGFVNAVLWTVALYAGVSLYRARQQRR